MKLQRYGIAAGAGVLALATLAACGTDNNSSSSASPSASSSASGSVASAIQCASGTLALHGSTAQANAISQWIKDYQTKCSGATINYNADGSGAGYTAFTGKQADFAGSDYALAPNQVAAANQRCAPANAENLPVVPGAIAVMYNVPGVSADTHLKLSAQVLGQIFSGKITTWNDKAIAAANPGVTLPSTKIQTFHRSDGSGTSYNFSNYLHSIAPSDWTAAANKQWPSSPGQGEKGSAAVAQAVKSTPGGIGYAEFSYATQNQLGTAALGNAQGQYVPISQQAAANFIAKAKVASSATGLQLNFDYSYSDPNAYPATLVTYEFVCASNTGSNGALIKDFLAYMASPQAQGELTGLGYVPLPQAIDTQVASSINQLKTS